MTQSDLSGRTALVTGGAQGLGEGMARALAAAGARVVVADLQVDAGTKVADSLGEGHGYVHLDVTDDAGWEAAVADTVARLGGLDILVNNAGYQQARDSILDITTEQLDATFKTNVYALVWIIQAALPHLRPGATIINTASINAYDPGEDIIDYAATKAAIASLTKSLSKQLTPKGIRVNAIAPGPYWTPLQVSGGQKPEKLPKFGADSLTGRPGQPAEIAPLYVLLASSESSFTSGDIFGSTGGKPQG